MSNSTVQRVLIVGGGIGGLASALALRRNGADVVVVERASAFGEVGAGLQMAPNATRILREWGLLDEVVAVGFLPRHIIFRDAITGAELTRQSVDGEFEARYGGPYLVVHRSDLHRILLQRCRDLGVQLHNNVNIRRVETVGTEAYATAEDGSRFYADVVIGADGLGSTLRRQVVDDEPVASAYVAYRGALPLSHMTDRLELDDVTVWLGEECHLVQYPLRNGEILNTVAVFRSPSFEAGQEEFGGTDELTDAYRDCVPEVRDALKNLWQTARWPMYDREPIDAWADGRMMLIGDAAHPMLQYLAQGACQAIEDASALEKLSQPLFESGSMTWDDVIDRFTRVRAPRTARVQRTARAWGESWHVKGIGRILRNMLFRLRTDADVHYTDWLYGDGYGEAGILTSAAAAQVATREGVVVDRRD